MNKQKLMSALQAELNRQFEYGAIMYHPDMGGQPMISYPIVYPAPRPVIDLERLADAVLGALALAPATQAVPDTVEAAQRIFEVMCGRPVDWAKHAADTSEDNLFQSADWECCLTYAEAALTGQVSLPASGRQG